MFKFRRRDGDYQRLARISTDNLQRPFSRSADDDNDEEIVFHAFDVQNTTRKTSAIDAIHVATHMLPWRSRRPRSRRRSSYPTRYLRLFIRFAAATLAILITIIILTPIVIPSYTYRPKHYTGTNPNREKVFIAANIVNEDLIRGAWGTRVLELIDIIGPENTFLSIYENDSGPGTKAALREFGQKVKCNSSIISGHINLDTFPSVQVLPGQHLHRRIQYLSEVRNRALRPLDSDFEFNMTTIDDYTTSSYTASDLPVFDKLLFLNDIVFSAADAADLLFATNLNPSTGRTDYRAACAMDFINAFKFYDMFALRDAEGYKAGVPFFPFFSSAGRGISRAAVLSQTDAVPVRACWGGMAAFEARWFQRDATRPDAKPLRFRAETDLFWDASECCLVHADLAYAAAHAPDAADAEDGGGGVGAGVFVNPFVRVAYGPRAHAWLAFTRRFERLYTLAHTVANVAARLPPRQLRRTEEPGQRVLHSEWVYDGPVGAAPANASVALADVGHWETRRRVARPGGFCGYRFMLTLKERWAPGERIWEKIEAPAGWSDEG